jgi:steroid 5-alpha reductase family enzyme
MMRRSMNPETSHAFVVAAAAIFVAMTLLWLVSVRLHNVAIVDVFWGLGFILIAVITAAYAPHPIDPGRTALVAAVAIWGTRLAAHIYVRNRGHGEDFRYRAFRRRDPRFTWTSLVKVFWLQAALMLVVAAPLWAAGEPRGGGPNGPLLVVGIAVWFVGFAFEAVGDGQLARFRKEPSNRGKVMDRGLWRFTRHPNYFGDATLWWGIYSLALANGAPLWTAVGPLLMTVLLLRVSGVALLERSLKRTKPEYADYVRRTSPFVPRPPKA